MKTLVFAYHVFTTIIAVAALTCSVVLFMLWRSEHQKTVQQAHEQNAMKGLVLDTADTVLLQHKTLGLLVTSQTRLTRITRIMAQNQGYNSLDAPSSASMSTWVPTGG